MARALRRAHLDLGGDPGVRPALRADMVSACSDGDVRVPATPLIYAARAIALDFAADGDPIPEDDWL